MTTVIENGTIVTADLTHKDSLMDQAVVETEEECGVRIAFLAAALSVLSAGGQAETRTLKTVDFEMPSDIRAQIPRSVKNEDIFVSDDFCFYVRQNLSFVFIGCVG